MVVEVVSQLQVQLIEANALVPYARNSRVHSPQQVQQIKASMLEWGWTNPILADLANGKVIVAGHGRLMAAQELINEGIEIQLPGGFALPKGKVPVLDCAGWTEAQRRAYVIADNKTALNSSWDLELLKVELDDLKSTDFDLSLIGFSQEELDDLFVTPSEVAEADPDEAPEVPETAYSVRGDTWLCGPHRVRCGSSTEMGDWEALMQGELADLQVCDPPYNVAIGKKNEMLDRADKGNRGKTGSIANDEMSDGDFRKFLYDFYACSNAVMKAGASIYVAHADTEGYNFRGAFKDAGFKMSGVLTWKKNIMVIGRSDYQWIHEPILYGWKEGSKHRWYGGRKNITVQEVGDYEPFMQMPDGRYAIRAGDRVLYVNADAVMEEQPTSIIEHEKPKRSPLHPTMKPVGLWERLMKNSARPRDIVIDGFGGSGTTMIAAERLGMVARLMELDPRFVDVICVRYFMLTGRVPVHAETGKEFPSEVIERLRPKAA